MKVVVINGQNHKGSTYHIGKMLADNLADLANPAFSSHLAISTSHAWAGLYADALQLGCDFSG